MFISIGSRLNHIVANRKALKKTPIIVTLSLSGGRGSVKIPIIKLIIIGTYTSGGGCPNPEFPTMICWKFVEFRGEGVLRLH